VKRIGVLMLLTGFGLALAAAGRAAEPPTPPAIEVELAAITALLPGRYVAELPDPRSPTGPRLRIYHEILPVRAPRFGAGLAFYHQISRDGFDADTPFQQKVYVFDASPDRPRNRMRSFVLMPGAASVSPRRGLAALAALDPGATLAFPPACIINWSPGEVPGSYLARVRRADCRYRSERFGQDISPDLTYLLTPDSLAVEDLLFGADGKSLVPSPGLAPAVRLDPPRQ
jgi:hypothetical protein